MNIIYALTEEIDVSENKSKVSYGITAYSKRGKNAGKIIISVRGITDNKEKLSNLVNDCNRLKLSHVHLYDVVSDFLTE